jgi:hypothetical protein
MRMRSEHFLSVLIVAALCVFSSTSVFSQEEEPPPQPPAAAQEEAPPEASLPDAPAEIEDQPATEPAAELKAADAGAKVSTSAGLRDPFWPIGYAPVSTNTMRRRKTDAPVVAPKVVEPPSWEEAIKSLEVKGIMKTASGAYVAVINGQVASEKEVVSAVFRDRTYSWTITKIDKSGIKFDRASISQ